MKPCSQAPQSLTPELLQEVKRLHFQTRRLADQGIVGRYRSAYRGTGIEFEEVREYVPGDDVRRIDWKVTARSRKPFIKSYREERELTVLIAVDVSGSQHSGSRNMLRADLSARVSAVLSFIALTNNDKVGLVTFADTLESYHPPRKARSAVWRILHEVLRERDAGRRKTDLAALFRFLHSVTKRRAIIFVISDFIDSGYELALATLSKRHDVTAIVVGDPIDTALPKAGIVRLENPETGELHLADLADAKSRERYHEASTAAHRSREQLFRRHGIGCIELSTKEPFMPLIRRYFESRRRSKPSIRAHR